MPSPSFRSVKFTGNIELHIEALEKAKARLRGAPKRIHQHRVTVGIHETEGAEDKLGYDGRAGQDAMNLASVAMIHEFGAGPIPERSWLRAWFDSNEPRLKDEMLVSFRDEYEGNTDAIPGLARKWGRELRAFIEDQEGHLEQLADATVLRKSAYGLKAPEVPLLATGQLVNAIKSRVDGADA